MPVCFFGTVLIAGCATVGRPPAGQREHALISSAEEVQLGRILSRKIVNARDKPWNDPAEQRQVNELGQKLARMSDRKEIVYYFQILDGSEVHAFALPGGYVYISRGLYEALDEQERAAVLAHEIGHIAARHPLKRLQAALGDEVLAGIVLLGLGREDPDMARQIGSVSDTVFDQLSRGYSRQEELLADRSAVKYLKEAGIDPQGMVRFLEFLDQGKVPAGGVFEVSSGPSRMRERIRRVEEEIAGEAPAKP